MIEAGEGPAALHGVFETLKVRFSNIQEIENKVQLLSTVDQLPSELETFSPYEEAFLDVVAMVTQIQHNETIGATKAVHTTTDGHGGKNREIKL